MSEIKTKIRTYNDVIDLFGEEKAADMLSEALDWSTIDPKNDKKNIMERKALLLDPYMTYEDEDYCKHIVAGFLGDRDLGWASGYIDEEKIKNGQVMPADLKSALSMALDNELSTSCAYLDALSSQCAEIFNKFAGYIEFAGLARGVLVPGEYELDYDALNADVSERFNIQYGFQCDQMLPDTLACLAAQKCVDDHNWCVENLELTEDAIMHAKPIENGSEGLPKDCWDLNPEGRPFAVTEPILHRLQSSAKLCARAGTTTQFTRMTVNQWFDKAERSRRSPLGRSVDIGRAASALNSQHEHAEAPQHLSK